MDIKEIISSYLDASNPKDGAQFEVLLIETGEEARAKLNKAKQELCDPFSDEDSDNLLSLQMQLSGEEQKIRAEIETVQENIATKIEKKKALEALKKKTTTFHVVVAIVQTLIILKIMEWISLLGVKNQPVISEIQVELQGLKEKFNLLGAYKQNLKKLQDEIDSLDTDKVTLETSAEKIQKKNGKLNQAQKIETKLRESEQNLQDLLSKIDCLEDFPIVLEALQHPDDSPLRAEALLKHLERAKASLDHKITETLLKHPEEISAEKVQSLLESLNEGMTPTTDPLYAPFTEEDAKAELQIDIDQRTLQSNAALKTLQHYSNRFEQEITRCKDLLIKQEVTKIYAQLQSLVNPVTETSLQALHEQATKLLLTASRIEAVNGSKIGPLSAQIRTLLQDLNTQMQQEALRKIVVSYEDLNIRLREFEILVSSQKKALDSAILDLSRQNKELTPATAHLYQELGEYEKQMAEWRELVTRYEELTNPNSPSNVAEPKKLIARAFQLLTQKVKDVAGTKKTPKEVANEIAQLQSEFPIILAALESATKNMQNRGIA